MRSALKAVGLMVFGLLAALGGLEVALRLAGVGGPAELDPTYDRPSSSYVPHIERRHPWSPPSGPVYRVAVIGDSFTTGYANQWGDSYARRLERLLNLNASTVPVELEVFAWNGTNTWQQIKYLDQALDWGAELIVLGVFINDSEDARDADLLARKEELLPRVPTGVGRSLLQTSRALAWIYMRAEDIRRNRAAGAYEDYIFDPDYSGWKKFRQAIRRFDARCRERDARLVAAIWPSMLRLEGGYPHRLAHERIARVLDEAGIPYLDLLSEFENKSSLRLAAYPGIDLHPNEIGHRIGATAIFEYLLDSGQIDSSYRPAPSWVPSEEHYRREIQRKRSPEHFAP